MAVELTEGLLSKAAGWEAMKRARAYIAQDQVLSSYWAAPLLRGVVQINGMSFRASMVIQNEIDIENLCTCREARETGQICAHSVAVGLHWLQAQQAPAAKPVGGSSTSGKAGTGPKTLTSATPSVGLRVEEDGVPAEISIILPPSLDRAAAADRIMVVAEARSQGKTCPLNALPKGRAYKLDEQDLKLLRELERLADGQTPAMLQLTKEAFGKLLDTLSNHPRVSLGRTEPVRVTGEPRTEDASNALPSLSATLEENGEIVLVLRSIDNPSVLTVFGDWVYANKTFRRLGLPGPLKGLLSGPVRISRAEVPAFLGGLWPVLESHAEANFKVQDFTFEPQPPKFVLELRGGLAQLSALLQCRYGTRIITPGVTAPGDEAWLPDPENPRRYSTRNAAAEREALARLQRAGFRGPDDRGHLALKGQDAVLNFFAREYPRLQSEWTVTMEERLDRSTKQNIERIEPRFTISPSGVQWFDLGVVFESSGGQKFSASDIQRLLRSGQSHVRLPNGKSAVFDVDGLQELDEVLRDCAPRQHENGYRINNVQATFFGSTLSERPQWKLQAPEGWRHKAGGVLAECPPLGPLAEVLRPYQKTGVAWLQFLRENGFGGVLADEMGLGKTLQALAFFWSVRQQNPGIPPMLVVCPTSLVSNWIAEAAKFTPTLKTLAIAGPDREELFGKISQHELIVTSYALMRRDAERYREFEFDTLVLDEAQHIKNRQTQNAQAVKSVRARQRVVLTGTPLENSVLDLWSIFDFLMPGYLGTAQDFRERYEQPIARDKDASAQKRLARRLKAFVLRRTKREVAPELPEKIQQIAYCEMTRDQRAVYEQVLEATRKEVLEATGEAGLARSRMMVLSALLRLRQICCDLRLLKLENVDPAGASAKLDLFSELLEEVIDGGHRALVFSQFTSMLALLKEELAAQGLSYCYLDGSTNDRAAVVRKFQEDQSIPLFLISLKAGGVGLNLTGADTVIHFDPWWNPAVEDQATDRAHRIGQTRIVTSYKLITRNTVEEKILTLQNRKRDLINATIAGEEQFASALSWEEIQELLA